MASVKLRKADKEGILKKLMCIAEEQWESTPLAKEQKILETKLQEVIRKEDLKRYPLKDRAILWGYCKNG